MGVRAHLYLPEELVEAVDKLAGKRGRSRFVEEAIREKLAREKQRAALQATLGALATADHPEWSTPEKTSEWVRKLRELDNVRLERKLRRLQEE